MTSATRRRATDRETQRMGTGRPLGARTPAPKPRRCLRRSREASCLSLLTVCSILVTRSTITTAAKSDILASGANVAQRDRQLRLQRFKHAQPALHRIDHPVSRGHKRVCIYNVDCGIRCQWAPLRICSFRRSASASSPSPSSASTLVALDPVRSNDGSGSFTLIPSPVLSSGNWLAVATSDCALTNAAKSSNAQVNAPTLAVPMMPVGRSVPVPANTARSAASAKQALCTSRWEPARRCRARRRCRRRRRRPAAAACSTGRARRAARSSKTIRDVDYVEAAPAIEHALHVRHLLDREARRRHVWHMHAVRHADERSRRELRIEARRRAIEVLAQLRGRLQSLEKDVMPTRH